ncbi:hypothetical protein HO173_007242 [Letharia columbiana]|uniref:Chloride channel protein n=1 Tax=Letharia columbiana TaxID=112416 RepID=A0A8H6FTW7_9LECA|nr:uncharacterized protein HO173_007242 [Letharia columbiana]KAF6234616.1 hypothetical protein HO173_007242 [Letharia columbiana]
MTDNRPGRNLRLSFAPIRIPPPFTMPRSASSHVSSQTVDEEDEEDDNIISQQAGYITPTSPAAARRLHSARTSELDLRRRMPSKRHSYDEHSSLLASGDGNMRSYTAPNTGRPRFSRRSSQGSLGMSKNHSRASSWGFHLASALGSGRKFTENGMGESKASIFMDERVWYDQFTSTDWVHDSIADAFRVRDLRARKDLRGRIFAWFDGAQGWILVAIIGCITACVAFFVNISETSIFDYKDGYCKEGWYFSKRKCCYGLNHCPSWESWGERMSITGIERMWIDFIAYVFFVVFFAVGACFLTLITKTEIPSAFSLSTLDENLGADKQKHRGESDDMSQKISLSPTGPAVVDEKPGTMVYYPAAGSGVAEVKVILSGFVVHGYLGLRTLVVKTFALILSVASGLSIGKEGPYVHIATCVGNIACRLFSKYNHNDGKRREILSASAASGVGVAFGAPISGVLFSLEEVSYYFPPKTLFRTFFCCIVAALSLKFLNPYGTGKIVIFEVRYVTDWRSFEMFVFILLGILGGALGALFIKACRLWARTFRRIPSIKRWPVLEVVLVALVTGLASFWNRYTKLAVTELLFELASPCKDNTSGLCPQHGSEILGIVGYLCIAFVIKSILTIITFGIKVPAGIYVPSMVVGGLMGRIVGHLVQYLVFLHPDHPIFGSCPKGGDLEGCITPGVYALVAAGATMCGVTRLSVTLAVILFELTGSLDHVLPFSLSVLVAKWTADALEPLSIYDLLTDMNSYPLLDNKIRPIFTSDLGDITPKVRSHRVIDISNSPLVSAQALRRKLEYLHDAGEIDGGLPVIRHDILVGLIPAPDLQFALDNLEDEEQSLCLMATNVTWHGNVEEEEEREPDPTDFTPYIDPAPVALDIHSPMDLVFQCFVKLGLRYICVLRDGQYAGLVHKKAFVKYVKELEEAGSTDPS